jgi:hypothetical protein
MMKWRRKPWTRAELEELLGLPELEANDQTRSENDGVIQTIYGTPLERREAAAPPIEGVDRIIAWNCSKYEPPDAQTLRRLEGIHRDASSLSPEQAETLVGEIKERLERAGDRCVASTRVRSGESADKWFMFRVCSKHPDLDD